MAWPVRGQKAPNFWDVQLKGYIDDADEASVAGTSEVATRTTALETLIDEGRLSEDGLSATYAAQFDATGKTTAEINAWLAATTGFGRIKRLVGTHALTGTLVLDNSDTYLDASGAILTRNADAVSLRITAGEGQRVVGFKLTNSVTGARTTYDIEIVNPFHTALERCQLALSQAATDKGGVYIYKDAGAPNPERCFMPVLTDMLIRNGVMKIENVTDVKVFGGWTWATYTNAPGAVELAGASNCSFINHDIVPSVNAGYLVSAPLSNLSIEGGLMDGNGSPSIHTGWGFKVANTAYIRKLTIRGVKFWNLWLGAIDLYDVRGAIISGNVFSQNNRGDNFYPDINMASCQANVISLNTFSAPDARTNKGKIYVEDGSCSDNVIDLNTMEYNAGAHYYSVPVVTIQTSTSLGSQNRPDVAWPYTPILAKAANYTILKDDLFNGRSIHGSGTITLTLPSAASVHAGNSVPIKNTGTGLVTVATVSAQTIDGLPTSITLSPGSAITLQSEGAGWKILSSNASAPGVATPPLAMLATVSATAWPAANTAIFQRFSVPEGRAYRYANFRIDTASGNYQVGVVRLSGATLTDYTRVMNSGVVTMPAAGDKHIDLGATWLPAGDYALFLWADNTTATLRVASNSGIPASRLAAEVASIGSGVPSTGTLAWTSSRFLGGITLETA